MQKRLLFAVAFSFCVSVQAADYSLDGVLRYDTSYDNNLQLSEQRQSAWGQNVSANINAVGKTERTSADVQIQLSNHRFNREQFDSDDQTLRLSAGHTFERSSVDLKLANVRDSTLNSELLDSGRMLDAQRRQQLSAAPVWSYQLSEKNLITLQGNYLDTRYLGSGYTDYRYWQTQFLWTHSLSERLRGFASISYSDYRSQPVSYPFGQTYATTSTDRGFQVGGDYLFSENLTASLLIGTSRNHTDPRIDDPGQFCPLARANPFLLSILPLCALDDTYASLATVNGSLSWRGERNDLSLNVSRATQPSSNGYVQQTEQIDLDWRFSIWEHGSLGLAVTAGATDAPNERSTRAGLSRDFEYATLSYTHSLNEAWLIDCNLRYRSQEYDQQDRVESNVIFIGISWKPKTQHWSR